MKIIKEIKLKFYRKIFYALNLHLWQNVSIHKLSVIIIP